MAPHTHHSWRQVVKHDHSSAVLQVLRYGLPLVILIFYISASWNFSYTPDSTYLSLRLARKRRRRRCARVRAGHVCATPNPLVVVFHRGRHTLKVDGLLVAKIFSLFFSCLVGVSDVPSGGRSAPRPFSRLLFRIRCRDKRLVAAGGPCRLRASPGVDIVLAALFFMLRNDYLLAALMIGLATLLFWQAAGGFLLLLWDA